MTWDLGQLLRISNVPDERGGIEQEQERCHADSNCLTKSAFGPDMKSQDLSDDALIYGGQLLVIPGTAQLEDKQR